MPFGLLRRPVQFIDLDVGGGEHLASSPGPVPLCGGAA
jgi:hypothetical protein